MMATIRCERHGHTAIAAVCGHLARNTGTPLGFVENSDDPEDKQGWCYACEFVFDQEQDKTQRFRKFCQHNVVCSGCYDEIKAHHQFDEADEDANSDDA